MNGKGAGEISRSGEDKLFLGVDGGKSKTYCLLARVNGRVIGWGRSGSSDKYYRPLDEALDEIALAVHRACKMAVISPTEVAYGAFGLAGADWSEDFEELKNNLDQRRISQRVLVKNDMHIALRANVPNGVGILISAGTHLAAAIRLADGNEWHSGWFSVDGAGGVYAGKRVFWAVMRAEDGRGHPTALTQLLLEVSGKDTPLSLLRDLSAGRLDDSFFASLAPLLFQAHQEFHDPVAAVIITEMGEDISLWATGLLDRFQLVHEPIPIILSGGIFKTEDPLLVDTILQKVHERVPRAEIRKACFEPVIGALLYAYELDAVPVTVELLSEIERSYAEITHTPCRN
jgi:N-acetylglucosamine kinase-like BadF-type ATPase